MRGLSMESDRMAFNAECSKNRAKCKFFVEQNWPLLDMQLEVRRGILQFDTRILHLLEINSD